VTAARGDGWAAIDAALARIYGDATPRHFTTVVKYKDGGKDPLDAISVYACDEGRPHWHFVTYGFSELGAKTSENRRKSGWGFEMSFRLARAPTDPEPESWPLVLLQQLARYVFESGTPFDVGHHIDLGTPLVQGRTMLDVLVFALDAKLGKIDTPNGRVKFLTPVGIFQAEKASIAANQYYGFLSRYSRDSPLFVTDLERRTVLV